MAELIRFGLILESDSRLPSVSSLIAGEPVHGSWWSHPRAQIIFQVNEELEDHEDVLLTKLISGKVTFVHRQLWSEVNVVGSARTQWQTKNLSANELALLKNLDAEGELRTDQIPRAKFGKAKLGDVARKLETRLLIVASQVHTETGAHAKVLETWKHWRRRIGFKPARVSIREAMRRIDDRVAQMESEFGAKAKLPWT